MKLVLRCDDFGCATGANEAILALAKTGLKFSVAILVCGPEARTGLEELAQYVPQISLGIHPAITSEWDGIRWGPIGEMARWSSLVDSNQHFHRKTDFAARLPTDLIISEVRAQIEEALNWGIPFSYMAEHMSFNWIPSIQSRHQALADEFHLIYKPDLPPLPQLQSSPEDLVLQWKNQIQLSNEGVHLLVTHPVLEDESTREMTSPSRPCGVVAKERHREFQALSAPAWQDCLRQEGVELVTYQEL